MKMSLDGQNYQNDLVIEFYKNDLDFSLWAQIWFTLPYFMVFFFFCLFPIFHFISIALFSDIFVFFHFQLFDINSNLGVQNGMSTTAFLFREARNSVQQWLQTWSRFVLILIIKWNSCNNRTYQMISCLCTRWGLNQIIVWVIKKE